MHTITQSPESYSSFLTRTVSSFESFRIALYKVCITNVKIYFLPLSNIQVFIKKKKLHLDVNRLNYLNYSSQFQTGSPGITFVVVVWIIQCIQAITNSLLVILYWGEHRSVGINIPGIFLLLIKTKFIYKTYTHRYYPTSDD